MMFEPHHTQEFLGELYYDDLETIWCEECKEFRGFWTHQGHFICIKCGKVMGFPHRGYPVRWVKDQRHLLEPIPCRIRYVVINVDEILFDMTNSEKKK